MTATVKTEWNGPIVSERERVGAAKGLYLAAENILEMATRIVPLNEGTLMRSGLVTLDEGGARTRVATDGHLYHEGGEGNLGRSQVAAVSYDTPYAVKQHEELDYQHQRGRQAKYLETPFNEAAETSLMLIAREIAASIEGAT